MAGGKPYTDSEDRLIQAAVEAGARTEPDFRPLALELARPANTVRHRAIRLGLITRASRPGAPAGLKSKRTIPFAADEDAFLLRAREKALTVREIAFALDRSASSVELRLAQLGARQALPREYAREDEPKPDVQAKACERHARACLAAGGFWALSERRIGRGQVIACLPLIPPPVLLEGAP
jgi:hypothetical protein